MPIIHIIKSQVPLYLRTGLFYLSLNQLNDDEAFAINTDNFKQDPFVNNLNDWIYLFNTCNFWGIVVPLNNFFFNHKLEIYNFLISLNDSPRTDPYIIQLLTTNQIEEENVDYFIFSNINVERLLFKYPYFVAYSIGEIEDIVLGNLNLLHSDIYTPLTTIVFGHPTVYTPVNNPEFDILEYSLFNRLKKEYDYFLDHPNEFDVNDPIRLYNEYEENLFYLNDEDIRKIRPLFIMDESGYFNNNPELIYVYRYLDLVKYGPFILYFYKYRKEPFKHQYCLCTLPDPNLNYSTVARTILKADDPSVTLISNENSFSFSIKEYSHYISEN